MSNVRIGRMFCAAITLAVLTAGWPAASSAQVVRIDRTVPFDQNGDVSLEVVTHGVVIESWDRAEVQVIGEYDSTIEELEIDASDDDFDLELSFLESRNRDRPDGSRELTVRVPAGTAVSVESVSGSVRFLRVAGVPGNAAVDLESVSGSIEFVGPASEVQLSSVSGSVTLEGEADEIEIETVSGGIRIEGGGAAIDTETVSGRTSISGGVPIRELSMESVSGALIFDGDLAPGGSIDAETFSGSVGLSFRSSPDARFNLETFSGSIGWDLPGSTSETVRSNRFIPGESVSFQVGTGSGSVDASTHSGSVTVEQD